MSRRIALLALAALSVPALLSAKPPWISIEFPANPWDQSARDAFLVVHTYHFNRPMDGTLTGRAIGIVNGARQSVALRFEPTGKPGDYVLRKQWTGGGRWVLVISVSQGTADNLAEALIRLDERGAVASVQVPTKQERQMALPRALTDAEIESALRGS